MPFRRVSFVSGQTLAQEMCNFDSISTMIGVMMQAHGLLVPRDRVVSSRLAFTKDLIKPTRNDTIIHKIRKLVDIKTLMKSLEYACYKTTKNFARLHLKTTITNQASFACESSAASPMRSVQQSL